MVWHFAILGDLLSDDKAVVRRSVIGRTGGNEYAGNRCGLEKDNISLVYLNHE